MPLAMVTQWVRAAKADPVHRKAGLRYAVGYTLVQVGWVARLALDQPAYLHGCYSLGDGQLWGVVRERKGGDHSLAALKSIRAARPDGVPIYVILDNLSANKTPAIRAWARKNKVELCFTPTQASWANPIEA